jgi:hypothetical protein
MESRLRKPTSSRDRQSHSRCHGRRLPPCFGILLLLLLVAPTAAQESATVGRFVASDAARSGDAVPLELSVTNTSSEPLDVLRVASNQVFRYELAVAVPPGQVRTVAFAPWYFSASLDLPDQGVSLQPRRLARDTIVVLFDPADLRAEPLAAALEPWRAHYLRRDAQGRFVGTVLPCSASLDRLTSDLAIDSSATALAVSADHPRLVELRRMAVAAGLDLWTVPGDGSAPVLADAVPTFLRRLRDGNPERTQWLSWKRCARPDLFDLSVHSSPDRIPEALFVSDADPWPLERRLFVLLPIGVGLLLFVCLALLGPKWPRWVSLTSALVVAAGSGAWALAEAATVDVAFVDTVTLAFCDATTGRTFEQHVASVTAIGQASPQVSFDLPGSGAPRPLVADDVDLTVYEGMCLARDLEGRWSARELPMQPGLLMAFGVGCWTGGDASGRPTITRQSSGPEVRFTSGGTLTDAWVFSGGQAWPMAEAASPGVYRATASPTECSAAAFSEAAPADPLHRRAVRWVSRYVQRSDVTVLFGWAEDESPITTDARRISHGRLMIYLWPPLPL